MSSDGEIRVNGDIAPGPSGSQVQEVFEALRSDALPTYLSLFDRHGDVARLQMGPFVTHFLFHPEHVKHVLVTAQHKYDKETYGNRRLRSYVGLGLLFSEGDTWQRQRRVTMPSLATNQHEMFVQLTREVFLERARSQREVGSDSCEIADVQEWVARPLFMAMMRGLMGRVLAAQEASNLRDALCTVIEQSQLPTAPKLRTDVAVPVDAFTRALSLLNDTILESIRGRKHAPPQPDFLGRLIEHADAEGHSFTEQELLDQVKTMLFAGHDTGAHALAFALHFLSERPELQAHVFDEIATLTEKEPLLQRVARMRWTEAIVLEALRLLPPAWAIERAAREDDVIAGYAIPKGSAVLLSPYVTHRHPQFWDDPLVFRPERFFDAQVPRHRYAYFPFGGGSRICVGNNLAMVQLKIALATVVEHFVLKPSAGLRQELQQWVVMRFRHGLPLALVPRS